MAAAEGPVMDVEEVGRMERSLADGGLSLDTLMRRAGVALASKTAELISNSSRGGCAKIAVLCGSGNNGGDGWVAARILGWMGHKVAVISSVAADEITAQPAHAAAVAAAAELETFEGCQIAVAPDGRKLSSILEEADVVIDAILGTGFSGAEVREPYRSWIICSNEQRSRGARIVAADAPSGLSARTGAAADPCIIADATVTMLVMKTGLCEPGARSYCGEISIARIAGAIG